MTRKKDKKKDQQASVEPKRITPVDIQQKEFRVAMRGYHEQDVDQFLDDVTEEVARLYADNKRLREELEFTGTRRLDVGEAAEAGEILRQAREDADRILADARSQAADILAGTQGAAGLSAVAAGELGLFIARERAFLQGLATMIQSHADGVKEALSRVRSAEEGTTSTGASPSGQPEQGAGPRAGRGSEGGAQVATAAWAASELRQADASPGGPTEADTRAERWNASSQAQGGEAEISGQDWTRYYTGPTTGARRSEPADAAEQDVDDILDLTHPSGSEGDLPSVSRRVEPIAAHGAEPVEQDDPGDRSLRELFWGED